MLLKEKFEKISCKDCDMPYCDIGCTILSDNELDRLEKIADEFAIGFATWYESNSQQREYYPMVEMSIKELLEIYKKEKGL